MKVLKKVLIAIMSVFCCTSHMSAQPVFQNALQMLGIDTNWLQFIKVSGTDIVFTGTTVDAVTVNTQPPVTSTTDPDQDMFDGIISASSLLTAACIENSLGYVLNIRALETTTNPVQYVVAGNFTGTLLKGVPVFCSTPVCGFLFRKDNSCQVTDAHKFESTDIFSLNGLSYTNIADEAVIAGEFTGQTTIGGTTKNAGFNQFGVLACYNVSTGSSPWQSWLTGTGFFSIDKPFFDKDNNHIYALGRIGISATYESSAGTTTITAPPPGNAYALFKVDASNGDLLDHTTFSSSGLMLPVGVIKFKSGLYVAFNSFSSNFHPDVLNPAFNLGSQGSVDIDAAAMDLFLNYQNSLKIGTAEEEFATYLRNMESLGQMAIVGYQERLKRFDQGNSTESMALSAQAILFLADSALNLTDSIVTGGSGFDAFFDADADSSGMIYTCGIFTDTTDLDPDTTSVFPLMSSGSFDGFIAKYDASYLLGENELSARHPAIVVYPNPVNDVLNIHVKLKSPESGYVYLYDATGRKLFEKQLKNSSYVNYFFDCSGLAHGVYHVTLIGNSIALHKKVVKH